MPTLLRRIDMLLSHIKPVSWRRPLLSLAVSALVLGSLTACGNDAGVDDGPPAPLASALSSGPEAAEPPAADAEPAVEPRQHEQFEIVGSFPGSIVAWGDHLVVTRGGENASLGSSLHGLSTWTHDGVLLGEAEGEPCQVAVADSDEGGTKIFASEEIHYGPQGIEDGGYRFVVTVYDDTLEQLHTLKVEEHPQSTDRSFELPFECPLSATRDGRHVLMGAGSGWYLIDTATYASEFIAPYWPDPESHTGGNHIVVVGDLLVQAAGDGTHVLDPAARASVVRSYPTTDDDEPTPGALLAEKVVEKTGGGWFTSAGAFPTVPDEPATVFLIDRTGEAPHLTRFDLLNGTIDRGAEATDVDNLHVARDGAFVYVSGDRLLGNGGEWIAAYDSTLRQKLWEIEGPTTICADSDTQIAVEVNGQIALLNRETGEQEAFTDQVGTSSFGNEGRCAPTTIGGYGWDINDDIVRGNGGEILSYFNQTEDR